VEVPSKFGWITISLSPIYIKICLSEV
jgi:hypothetical protein